MATENVTIRFRTDGTRVVERDIGRIQNRATQAGSALQFVKRALVFTGVGVALRGTLSTIAQFEQTLSTVRGITGATDTQFAQLTATARELGATTRFSATQAGEGLLFLSRAGFSAAQAMEAVPGTLNLAQAGALDLGTAADIASNVLQGFRLQVDQTGRVVDVLAKAANSSNTDVQQLGDAIKLVGPVAAGVNVSLEETTAAIGALSNAGLQGTLAGTGLRRVISELESPSAKTAKLLGQLGLTTQDVRVSQVGLTEAIKRLAEQGIDTAQALEIFGDRGGPAFEVLSSSIPDVERLNELLANSAGTADELSKIMDDNLNGALLAVRSAFEAVVLSIGDLQGSFLEDFFRGLATGLRFVADNAKEVAEAVGAGLLVPALFLATSAVQRFTLAIAANPVGLITVALSTLISTLVFFRDEIKLTGDGVVTLNDLLLVFRDNLVTSFEFVRDLLSDLFGPFVESTRNDLNQVQSDFFTVLRTFAKAADFIVKPFQLAFQTIYTVFRFGFQALGELVINFVNKTIEAFNGLALRVQRILNAILEKVQVVLSQTAGVLSSDGVIDIGAGSIALPQLGQIENQFAGAGETLGNALKFSFERTLQQDNALVQSIDAFAAQAQLKAQERLAAETNASILTPAEGGGEGEGTINSAAKQLEELNNKAEEGKAKFGDFKDAVGGFKDAFKEIEVSAKSLGKAIGDAVINTVDRAADALADFALSGFQDVESLREAFSNLLADLAKQILKIIIQTLILKAIQGALGVSGGSAIGSAVGGAAVGAGSAALDGQRAAGGPVGSGGSFLVGENGPEVFSPTRSGNITPVNPAMQSQPPVINIVNVEDKEASLENLQSPEAQQVILNTVRTNQGAL